MTARPRAWHASTRRLRPVRPAVAGLHGEGVHAVVAPVAAAGELRDGHKLDGRDAEVAQSVEVGDDGVEGPLG